MFGVTIHCQSVLRIWPSSFNTMDKLRVFDELATCHVLFAIIKTTSGKIISRQNKTASTFRHKHPTLWHTNHDFLIFIF